MAQPNGALIADAFPNIGNYPQVNVRIHYKEEIMRYLLIASIIGSVMFLEKHHLKQDPFKI